MVANPEIAFSVFFGSSYCQQPLFLSTTNSLPAHHVGIPASLVSFLLFLYLGGRILLALPSLLLSFQKNSLHDHEENEPSHLYCTLVVCKNLTAVLKGRCSQELLNF